MARLVRKLCLGTVLLGLSLGLSACDDDDPDKPSQVRGNFVSGGEKVYFSFSDPAYDDKGPGFYTYPLAILTQPTPGQSAIVTTGNAGNVLPSQLNQGFDIQNRTGFFDITDFRVSDGGINVVFEISTARPIPKFRDDLSSGAKGWFLQLMDIYIDMDHKVGSGRTRSLPGRNVSFTPECGWEKMMIITPQVSYDVPHIIEQITSDMDFVNMKKDIIVPPQVFVQGYTFRILIPKGVLGEPQPNWGYQVMMMLYNPQNLAYGHFQEGRVQRFPGNNIFGGADEYNGHPNIIDVLAPTADEQYRWLSNFTSSPNTGDNRYAYVNMLYPPAPVAPKKTQPQRFARRNIPQGPRPAPQPVQQAYLPQAQPQYQRRVPIAQRQPNYENFDFSDVQPARRPVFQQPRPPVRQPAADEELFSNDMDKPVQRDYRRPPRRTLDDIGDGD
jgi:hypothetical protein